jgi:hypothetical protein
MPSKDPLFSLWWNIKNRCFNPAVRNFKYYGGRKITGPWMFEPWIRSFAAFRAYLLDTIGPRPSAKHSLDRKKNNTGYVPGNLRWALPVQQNNNTRKNKPKPPKTSRDLRQHATGTAHGSAKLTEELVRQIRAEFASGTASTAELGIKYGLHRNTVNLVIQRASRGGWAHVA